MLLELVVQRLGVHDMRLEVAHELVDRGSERLAAAEDEPHRLILRAAGSPHRQDAGTKLAGQRVHELAQRRFAHVPQRRAVAIGDLPHELLDLGSHLVDAGGLGDDRRRSVAKGPKSIGEARLVREDRDGHDRGHGRSAEPLEQGSAALFGGIAD